MTKETTLKDAEMSDASPDTFDSSALYKESNDKLAHLQSLCTQLRQNMNNIRQWRSEYSKVLYQLFTHVTSEKGR